MIPSFWKGGGSRYPHEMILSGMQGMDLLISPSIQTYSANTGIWRGSIPMYTIIFWVTLASDFTTFRSGVDTGFYDVHEIYVG